MEPPDADDIDQSILFVAVCRTTDTEHTKPCMENIRQFSTTHKEFCEESHDQPETTLPDIADGRKRNMTLA